MVDEAARTRMPTRLDLIHGRFARGATEFRRSDGTAVRAMSIKRTDLTSALSLIKRVGIPFGLALEADEAGRTTPSRAPRESEKNEER